MKHFKTDPFAEPSMTQPSPSSSPGKTSGILDRKGSIGLEDPAVPKRSPTPPRRPPPPRRPSSSGATSLQQAYDFSTKVSVVSKRLRRRDFRSFFFLLLGTSLRLELLLFVGSSLGWACKHLQWINSPQPAESLHRPDAKHPCHVSFFLIVAQ